MAPSPIPIPLFARAQQQLLLREHEAEKLSSALATSATTAAASTRRTLQATGYALTGLILEHCRTGMGGRVVGEFGPDAATSPQKGSSDIVGTDGRPSFGAHGIRVGDVVRVLEIASGTAKKPAKDGVKARPSKEAEGVVTKVSERAISIAFGQSGGGAAKHEEEAVDELWGKKLWL